MPSQLPAVEFAQRTDPGRDPDKHVNEDACGYRETRFGHLCVVCDGMGGHVGGREASNLALETIFEWFEAAPVEARPREVLAEAIRRANGRVFAMADPAAQGGRPSAGLSRPGSTVVAILVHASGTDIAHVGDSRCYLAHAGQIVQVTKDHSMVQEMVDVGVLTPEQAAVHPDANRITRALGMAPEVDVDLAAEVFPHVAGDTFVLASDGLSDLVNPQEILQIVAAVPPAQAVGQLVDLANARGGHDNITVEVLRTRESARVQAGQVSPTIAQTVAPTRVGLATEASAAPAAVALGGPAPVPAAPVFVPPPRDEPPPSVIERRRARLSPTVVIGVILALVGVGVAATVLYLHVSERGGSRRSAPAGFPTRTQGSFDTDASPVNVAPDVDASTR
jgi:serine/threonine protein phosphatase PrpC